MKMANEKQLIYVEPIKKFIVDRLNSKNAMEAFGYDAIEILAQIECTPTVDAVEAVHGRWVESTNTTYMKSEFACSVCGKRLLAFTTPYCPNCGAKMDGGSDG